MRARIAALAIPPAWRDVWICPWPNGHLQAVGTDAAGRRQYRYHDRWRQRRDQEKFDHMVAFARCLPELWAWCHDRLTATEELSRDRVLAGAVRLFDLGFFRVGGESYAEKHQTYGLPTIRKSHVHLRGDEVTFDYVAKSANRPKNASWPRPRRPRFPRRRNGKSGDGPFAEKESPWTHLHCSPPTTTA